MRPLLWIGVCNALAAGCAANAYADDARGPFRLVWVRGERTESCADRMSIADGVTRRLGRNVFSDAAPRSIEAVVQHEGDTWEAHIYVRGDDGRLSGSRILTSRASTCASVEAAVTLAIALAIDPDAALDPSRAPQPSRPVAGAAGASAPSATPTPSSVPPVPCPPPEPPPPPPVVQPPPAVAPPPCPLERPCPPSAPAPASGSPGVAVAVRAVAAFGLLPGAAPGFALSTDVPLTRFVHGTAGAEYLPERRTSDGAFAFGMTAAWLGACVRPLDSSSASLSFCATGQAGGIHAVVFSLTPTRPGDQVWAGASVGGVLRVRLVGPLETEIGGEAVVPLTRYPFAVKGGSTVFQQDPVAGVAYAGAGMSFR